MKDTRVRRGEDYGQDGPMALGEAGENVVLGLSWGHSFKPLVPPTGLGLGPGYTFPLTVRSNRLAQRNEQTKFKFSRYAITVIWFVWVLFHPPVS
jgi:hypothetical protein